MSRQYLRCAIKSSPHHPIGPPPQDAIVASLEPVGEEPAPPLATALHFPAGRPSGEETAERLGFEATAELGADGSSTLRLRSRRLIWGLRVECAGMVCEEPLVAVEPGRERLLRLRPVAGAEPAGSVSIRALNMRARTAVPIS